MKRMMAVCSILAVFGTVVSGAEEDFPENPTIRQVCNEPAADGKNNIQTMRLVYKVSDIENESGLFMIRATQTGKIRLDTLADNEIYSAGRQDADFWSYAVDGGFQNVPKFDSDLLLHYVAALALPVNQNPLLENPVYKRDEVVNNVKRSVFEVRSTIGENVTYELSVEKKTHYLRRAKLLVKGRAIFSVLYRDYRTFNGQKLARHISTSNPFGSFQMTLVRADWDVELPDSIFKNGTKIKDADISLMTKNPAAPAAEPKVAQKQEPADSARIDFLERKIMKLKLEIEFLTKKVSRKESTAQSSRSRASNSGGGNGFWGYSRRRSRGRRGRGGGGGSSGRSLFAQWAQATENRSEARSDEAAYEKACQELLQKRTELNDAEYELKKLKGK